MIDSQVWGLMFYRKPPATAQLLASASNDEVSPSTILGLGRALLRLVRDEKQPGGPRIIREFYPLAISLCAEAGLTPSEELLALIVLAAQPDDRVTLLPMSDRPRLKGIDHSSALVERYNEQGTVGLVFARDMEAAYLAMCKARGWEPLKWSQVAPHVPYDKSYPRRDGKQMTAYDVRPQSQQAKEARPCTSTVPRSPVDRRSPLDRSPINQRSKGDWACVPREVGAKRYSYVRGIPKAARIREPGVGHDRLPRVGFKAPAQSSTAPAARSFPAELKPVFAGMVAGIDSRLVYGKVLDTIVTPAGSSGRVGGCKTLPRSTIHTISTGRRSRLDKKSE